MRAFKPVDMYPLFPKRLIKPAKLVVMLEVTQVVTLKGSSIGVGSSALAACPLLQFVATILVYFARKGTVYD